MPDGFSHLIGQPLRRLLYYRPGSDANLDLNWPGVHDVGQGVELAFDEGHCFVTWDHAVEEEVSVRPGRLVDFLRAGAFEDVSAHVGWQPHVGQGLVAVQVRQNEVVLQFGERQVYVVTAEVDMESLLIDGMADNLVVFFHEEARREFFAQYPGEPTRSGPL